MRWSREGWRQGPSPVTKGLFATIKGQKNPKCTNVTTCDKHIKQGRTWTKGETESCLEIPTLFSGHCLTGHEAPEDAPHPQQPELTRAARWANSREHGEHLARPHSGHRTSLNKPRRTAATQRGLDHTGTRNQRSEKYPEPPHQTWELNYKLPDNPLMEQGSTSETKYLKEKEEDHSM